MLCFLAAEYGGEPTESNRPLDVALCISREILAEYFAVLGRFGMAGELEGKVVMQLFEKRCNQVFVSSPAAVTVIKEDAADSRFLECAVAADATYILPSS